MAHDALCNEQRSLAEAKARALAGALAASACGWPAWEPTPPLLLACADLAASVARHLALGQLDEAA